MSFQVNQRAVGWALLSQSIWLPLVVIDATDRWKARVKTLTPPTGNQVATADGFLLNPAPDPVPVPPTRLAISSARPARDTAALGAAQPPAPGATRSGLLLNGALPDLNLPRSLPDLSLLRRAVVAPLQNVLSLAQPSRWMPPVSELTIRRPSQSGSSGSAPWQGPPIPTGSTDLLLRTFTRSELLGGTLSLNDLDTSPMSPVALAERARWASSADPMAPLPAPWRDPMRRALGQISASGSRFERARIVHVPSLRVTRTTEIPLALQSDGSVDILSQPGDPGVVRDIEEWSSRQQPPVQGGVLPAVITLHPVPAAAGPAAPAATGGEAIPTPIVSESQAGTRPFAYQEAAPRAVQPAAAATAAPAPSSASGWEDVAPSEPAISAAPEPAPAVVAVPAPQRLAEASPPAPEPEWTAPESAPDAAASVPAP